MVRYEYQSLVPIFSECFPYVLINTFSVIIQQGGIRPLGVHETNLHIGKFLLDVFVSIPKKKKAYRCSQICFI